MAVSSDRRRAHVVLPADLLPEIDERVGQRHRSEFIQEAIENELQRRRRVEAFERVVGSIADGENPDWETRETTAEWLTELREEWESPARSSEPRSDVKPTLVCYAGQSLEVLNDVESESRLRHVQVFLPKNWSRPLMRLPESGAAAAPSPR
jgi:hypothetical protein